MDFKLISISKSTNPKKKYMATFRNKTTERTKKIHFGASGYRDFTLISSPKSKFYIKDKNQRLKVRDNYQRRHKKDLSTEKNKIGFGAGALSYYVLWTAPTVNGGIKNYIKKYNISK